MASASSRYGNALLALTTIRPPDPDRGSDVVHLHLTLPNAVASQVQLWNTGGRGPVDTSEAAQLLWGAPVAQYLDGRPDAWLGVPGVVDLMPGLLELAATDRAQWPASQSALRSLVAGAAPGSPSWTSLAGSLKKSGTLDLLNDLVLIFKYAAIDTERPVTTAAEMYRLLRALTAPGGGPGSVTEVVAWMTAPLVVPSVLTTPPGPGGPRPPVNPVPPDRGPRWPPLPPFDLTSPRARRVLDRIDAELTSHEDSKRSAALEAALRDAGVRDGDALRRIIDGIRDAGDVRGLPHGPTDIVVTPPERRIAAPQVIRTHLYGMPVMLDVAAIRARTARVRHELALRVLESLPDRLRDRIRSAGLALEDLPIWPDLLSAVEPSASHRTPVGRSDLLLVRQTTIGYRRAEIAYIENILVGETREREHTSRVLTRQEFFERVERETEETRDLQVSDQAELSREVSNVVNEDLAAQGSVQVTSRGPTTVVAAASVSYGRSTEEAATSAESYSRETIERAVKRTMERVTREVRSLFEQETTEVNHHAFERAADAPDHVSGVYQYLERISHARIFWYGERELYDLLIPEPAALIWQLAISRNELSIPIDEPDADLFDTLTLENIADKREDVIRAFRVTDMPPLPAETQEVSMSFSGTGGGDSAKYASAKELQIPDGYVVTSATFVASAEVEDEDDDPNGGVTVAGQVQLWEMTLSGNKGSITRDFSFPSGLVGPAVSVAVNADNFTSIAGSVTLSLRLTDDAREAWALAAYGRVAERYEQLRREYAQAVVQATANQQAESVSLPVGSRQKLQSVVRAELQRSAIDVMRNAPTDVDLVEHHPYANPDGTLGAHPVVDLAELGTTEPSVRFLQQAFEWEHLAWILYPYFWGRRSEWSRTIAVSHQDPDFAAFLNAGAARVQVPVRPGFEGLVKHFMETGEVYGGEGLPKMGDPGYVSFIDEQLTGLGAPGEEVPWPPGAPREWDIVAPTSLVLARTLKDAQLPSWDPATGKEV